MALIKEKQKAKGRLAEKARSATAFVSGAVALACDGMEVAVKHAEADGVPKAEAHEIVGKIIKRTR